MGHCLRDFLISLDRESGQSLQSQLREVLVSAILAGHIQSGEKLPSTRHLSRQIGISRNTVVLVYQSLVNDGYLETAERSGYFVSELVGELEQQSAEIAMAGTERLAKQVEWGNKLHTRPSFQSYVVRPTAWRDLPFPFIFGQPDPALFPLTDWRECVHKAMGKQWIDEWSNDVVDRDDPLLVEQIRTRILPRRGILAGENQILITLGAQQSLYLIASLLVNSKTKIAFEDPGYVDARNIFSLRSDNLQPVAVDAEGLPVDARLDDMDIVYTTPSHQYPTTVTMPPHRRKALLEKASAEDFLIVEDDYELESNYVSRPLPALKSGDAEGRVIYVGSFSKMLFPGLRLGFVVAAPELIRELRAMRRQMVRHAPMNNQRSAAFFLSAGYFDVYIRRLHRAYRERWIEMGEALDAHFPNARAVRSIGGSSFWVQMPSNFNTDILAKRALEQGVFIEPSRLYFHDNSTRSAFRLGFSSIATEKIRPGIQLLAEISRRI